jgi:CRISPR/Cas system-associated endonuclease Cas3-HD
MEISLTKKELNLLMSCVNKALEISSREGFSIEEETRKSKHIKRHYEMLSLHEKIRAFC